MRSAIGSLICGSAFILAQGCHKEGPQGGAGFQQFAPGGNAATSHDLQIVDEYLLRWDQFATGKNELAPYLRENKSTFEAALTRLMDAKDKRAPARLVFYSVVQVGGFIPVDSELGNSVTSLVGPDLPITTSKKGEKNYFAGDLFFWWQDNANANANEPYPLFEEWLKRDFAQRVAIPMYKSACKRK